MAITNIIRERNSVRSYLGKPLDNKTTKELKDYISSLSQPLGGKARIELISTNVGNQPVKLGTYGVISGASDFLVLVYKDGPLAAENAGYLFEQVVLHCTEMGLGTCWLGGTFKKSGFAELANVGNDEVMRIVSPVGYPAVKTKLLDRIMRAGAGSDKRKLFGNLFFDSNLSEPLERGGIYDTPLEMVRLAPSASNSQPWRIIVDENKVHFYFRKKSHLTDIDMGIALCHFELTCNEIGIDGAYKILADFPAADDLNYLISWV